MKFYEATLKTAGKTAEDIIKDYDGPKPLEKEINMWIEAFNAINGLKVVLLQSPFSPDHFSLGAWDPADDDKIRDFFYAAEQDPVFGCYIDQRDQFLEEWKREEYESAGSLIFDKDDVIIVREINTDKEAAK
jgi:hypothetical protein